MYMKIYANNLEQEALDQFKNCLSDDSCIDWALMPDAHTWYTLPIWWVIINKWKIFPAYVWYDIGCWMCSIKTNLNKKDIVWSEQYVYDEIYKQIPCWEGLSWSFNWSIDLPLTEFGKTIWISNGNQIWTLWGWNHFIEIWYDEDDVIWITVHSWSRWFGWKIADHYMRLAKIHNIDTDLFEKQFEESHMDLKNYNLEKYWEVLQQAISKFILSETKWECWWNNWFYIDSLKWQDYIMDMTFALEYALLNRKLIINKVLEILWWKELLFINKNHNCADFLDWWLVRHRKWATSAWLWELWVIPWNMKDWTVIVQWLWNKDFLECSSHWAWRVLWRRQAQKTLLLKDFQDDMIWIMARVEEWTKDESRFAYKNFEEVIELQKESVKVLYRIKPLINIKW